DDFEIRLVQQVANHCAIALRQSRLYQAAQKQVEELERLNHLKDDFLSTVSHELRTPMSSIKLAIQMLEVNLDMLGTLTNQPKITNYLRILKTECQREISLINDLLDLARLDVKTEALTLSPMDLQLLIPQIVEPFLERTYTQQQCLEIRVPDHLPTLVTDAFYLERILVELLNNACKYTPSGETIILSVQAGENELEIQVSNSGVEISAEEQDRIFDKFYRIANNDPWKFGGTGLGLALVKKLAEGLGATVQVQSGQGKTTFALKFSHL
ncbi:MAG: ATP-binding protein, partial [Leptolyngbyaceae bacterium]|nr:ATP-binding protein [Leptolyngbyaceae bacterium]